MKKDKLLSKMLSGSLVIPLCFMFAFLFAHTNVVAQDKVSKDPILQFVTKFPDSPLSKFYLADPNNPIASVAIKNQIVIKQSGENQLSAAEIQKLQQPIDEVLAMNKKAELMVQDGETYEHAIQVMQRQEKTSKANRPNQSPTKSTQNVDGVPVLSVPAGE